MNIEEFFDRIISVKTDEDGNINIIDQTLLPGEIKRINLNTKEEIWEAIKKLRVRGAPAIGVCAALGIAKTASQIQADNYADFHREFLGLKDYFASSRPTAVNLFWALNRMEDTLKSHKEKDI
ncbi:MAG: S-methyl-5-thioribose-1-phosphate isomerase, partial [Lachnoanaerobaculum saburreum]